MTPQQQARLARTLDRYMLGIRPSVRMGLQAELRALCDDVAEDARREVLDGLADIVVALEDAAAAPVEPATEDSDG